MTIIFDNVNLNPNQEEVKLHKVKGCEKLLMVRVNGQIDMAIESVSQCDPLSRPLLIFNVNGSQDICLSDFPCIACGQDLIFRVLPTTAAGSQLFVQILDETCVPESCCVNPC